MKFIKNTDFILNIYLTLIFMFISNKTIICYFFEGSSNSPLRNGVFKLTLVALLFSILLIVFSILYLFNINKVLLVLIGTLSIISDYFMRSYGILIDETVFQSIFETSKTEAIQYYNLKLLIEIIALTTLFIFLINKIKYKKYNFTYRTQNMSLGFLTSFCIVSFIGLFFYKDYAAYLRNNRKIRHMVNPINYIYQSYNYIQIKLNSVDKSLVIISEDAKMKKTDKPMLFVFVLGETARASSFQLNGYNRPTNPNIIKEKNIVNFQHTVSCGTATAVSVPCLFSHKGKSNFNKDTDLYYENLIDIINRVGFESVWVENNTGCKGVCDRIKRFDLNPLKTEKICNSGGCFDEILLLALDKILLEAQSKNLAIYLHMLGSHGPTYHLRYPPSFGVFKPECSTSKLSDCSYEQIINSYDNTILYTEYVIYKIINKLSGLKDINSTVLYVSDHGESLGEKGIYLHSLPYLIAPKEQKHIPFFLWFSDSNLNSKNGKIANSYNNSKCKISHDNVFHSTLDFFEISSRYLNESMSVFNQNFKCEY